MRTMWAAGAAIAVSLVLGGMSPAALGQTAGPEGETMWPRLESSSYGRDDPGSQVIDVLRLEPREEPRPAVILFHPGGLTTGEPLWDEDMARLIASWGYVPFMAGYRLLDPRTGADAWPAQLDDAQHAARWVRVHAAEFGADPDRLCAQGHSAGGMLASLLGTTDTRDDSEPDLAGISSRVDCVVTLAGTVDLTVPVPDPAQMHAYEVLFGASFDEDPGAWRAASPVDHVDGETVPFLVIHGNQDVTVPIEQARNFADALAAADREFVYAELPADHFDIVGLEATTSLVKTFLDNHLLPER